MHAKQQIHIGILIWAASLISFNGGASLSMLMPSSQRYSAIEQQSHLIDPIPTNLRQNNYSKRNGGVQPKPDQDVLDLENLKHANDDEEKKLSALEAQLGTEHNGQHGQEETPPIDNIDKEPTDSDATIHATSSNDDNINDNFNINENANGDHMHSPPPKQYHGAARLAFGQNPEINAEYLFKHSGGQYSALDMAQYVFWTGDEEGVAKAVEEFIRKGLMSRESAIKFLRDISMGIDYLENAYSTNRQFDQLDDNTLRKEEEYHAKKLIDRTLNGRMDNTHRSNFVYDSNDLIEPVSTTSTTTTTTVKPIIVVEKSVNPPFADLTLPLIQLNEIQNERINERTKEHSINFDEQSGRLRLADFLYAEYSLEEVIYQLAKVMFAQSLSKGSEETQIALQRLTAFLETEGATGRISPALQKKVLDVLFVALSDCLAENPQLISAARLSLSEATNPLPKLSDKH